MPLHGSLSGEILHGPGTLALKLSNAFVNLSFPDEGGDFAEICKTVIVTADLGIVKVLQAAGEVKFRVAGSHRQFADVNVSASQNQRGLRPPNKRRIVLHARGNASGLQVGFVSLPQQGIIQEHGQVARSKIEGHLLVFPQKLAALHLDVRNGERDKLFERPLPGRQSRLRNRRVRGAIGIVDQVNHGMFENQ